MSALDHGPALLFCPADRPDRIHKALARADAVIVDLEDAVADAAKPAAREALVAADLDPDRVIVRVNRAGTADRDADLTALAQTRLRTVMLAKASSAADVDGVDGGFEVVALCETAAGVQAVAELAARPTVVALMWGAEDLVASLGGSSSRHPSGGYRDVARFARAQVLLAAGAHGKAAIDAVHLDIHDEAGLAAEAADAAASGFAATACIHPAQVETVRTAYRPSDETIVWARDLLAAGRGQGGVFAFRGGMVDEPVLRQARRTLARAGCADPPR
ncbi:HpcH/HpaI aldolase/citrate lyase family protein [Microbacterium sp.]|uniref:HpcH/HpaI aldolase/citrate lyase family protein n=1 Tax=Microbacterium sp. TaxID=51671 RepID=UPI003A8A0CB8